MHAIGAFLVNALVVLFFVGLAGSSVVVVISFFEDLKELFGDDETVAEPHAPPRSEPGRSMAYTYAPAKEPLHRF